MKLGSFIGIITGLPLSICRASAATDLLDVTFIKQLLKGAFDGDLADVGTLLDQIRLFELSESTVNHIADAIRLRN